VFGVNPTTLSSWKSRKIIPYEYMYALSKTHNISFDWLITGEGVKDRHQINEENAQYTVEKYNRITRYNNQKEISQSLESNRENDMSSLAFPKNWFSKRHLIRENLVAIDIIGDSMGPEIPNGSIVLIDTTQKELKNGEMYVFNIDGDLLIKTIIHNFDGYIARSKNPNYPEIKLNKDQVSSLNIVGRAVRAFADIKL